MRRLGLIGGTGLDQWPGELETLKLSSKYGQPSADLAKFSLGAVSIYFLPRHGYLHSIPPHAVNYRANIDVFQQAGVEAVIAVNAVGGISDQCGAGSLCFPDQLIDYTWGREHSFSLTADDPLNHIEFANPFEGALREALVAQARQQNISVVNGGCLAVTQGPRLETAAEILKLRSEGCDLVGMTSMPEAALAREAGLDYASLCVVSNKAAGLEDIPVSMAAIEATLASAMSDVQHLLGSFFKELSNAG